MIFKKGFTIGLCGDLNLEGMLIFVCYDDQIIAEIDYEKGIDNLEIAIIFSKEESPKHIFQLDEFLNTLEKAKALAMRCAKEDALKNQIIDFLKKWDPISVSAIPGAQDEYHPYAYTIYEIIEKSNSYHDLFTYLWELKTQNMGLKGNQSKTEDFAQMLFNEIKPLC